VVSDVKNLFQAEGEKEAARRGAGKYRQRKKGSGVEKEQ